MSYPRRLFPLAIRSLAFGSISGTYAAVGAACDRPLRMLRVVNGTDAALLISYDGSTDHMAVLPGQTALLDICTNRVRDDGFFIAEGTQFFAKQALAAPTTGRLYIEMYGGAP